MTKYNIIMYMAACSWFSHTIRFFCFVSGHDCVAPVKAKWYFPCLNQKKIRRMVSRTVNNDINLYSNCQKQCGMLHYLIRIMIMEINRRHKTVLCWMCLKKEKEKYGKRRHMSILNMCNGRATKKSLWG